MLVGGVACAAVGLSAARAAKRPARTVVVERYSGPMSGELIEDPAPLRQVLPEVKLDTMPLGRAIDTLRRTSGANIYVNWQRLALFDPPVGPATPVVMEVRLKNATLGQALAKVLESVPARPDVINPGGRVLSAAVRDGIITVSDDARELSSVGRWYYVRDLLNDPGHFDFARPAPPPSTDQSMAPAAGVFDYGTTRQDREDQLTRIITDSVDPESWRDAGGTVGSIRSWAGRLIIRQTPDNHEKIESLLANLRKGS
jgi:hypothetical protein